MNLSQEHKHSATIGNLPTSLITLIYENAELFLYQKFFQKIQVIPESINPNIIRISESNTNHIKC